MSNESSFTIHLPESTRADLIDAIEAGDYPDWCYPKTLDESLDEYVTARRGRFDEIGFAVFPDDRTTGVHYESPVDTPPDEILDAIEDHRRPVFRESYTLHIDFTDDSWDTVTDITLEGYYVLREPTDR